MRFIHCADIHLDSPLRGLARYEGAPVEEVRSAPRRAFEQLVDFAIGERVDFVVVAGDLYDGDWQDFNTGLFFTRQMARLGGCGIPAYVLRGNHDASSRITRALRLPDNVHLIDAGKPQTIVDEHLGLAVHGQSFARADVADDLAAAYPRALPGLFNLGMLHTALNGRAGHQPYAPTSLDVLRSKGYDYWALGHVHAREIVATEPWVVFPGNLQGRHIREQGAKGAELVEVRDGVIRSSALAFDVLRWCEIELTIDGLADLDALLDLASTKLRDALAHADDRALAVRVNIIGRGSLHRRLVERPDELRGELRNCAVDLSGGRIWLEKIATDVRPAVDLARLAAGDDPIGLLLQSFETLRGDHGALSEVAQGALADLWAKLPSELSEGDDGARVDSAAELRALLVEAQDELLARLIEGGEA